MVTFGSCILLLGLQYYTLKTIVLKLNPLVLDLALSKISLRDSTRSAILAPVEVLLLLSLSKCCR